MALNLDGGMMAGSVDVRLCSESQSFTSSMTSATASVVKVGSEERCRNKQRVAFHDYYLNETFMVCWYVYTILI